MADNKRSLVQDVDSSLVEGAISLSAHLSAAQKRPATDVGGDGRPKRIKIKDYEFDMLPDDEQGMAKWRGDPAQTFSDWSIEVVSEGPVPTAAAPAPAPEVATSTPTAKQPSSMVSPSPQAAATAPPAAAAGSPATPQKGGKSDVIEIQTTTSTYHVHRYFLGFGTRRSEYFAKLFQEAKTGVSRASKTKLELEPLAAKAFPDVLDFLYDPRSPLMIETETATALHYLGGKLEMEHLAHYAKEFCQKDISLETLELYYAHAKMFSDDVVMAVVVEFIGKNISSISSTSNFVRNQTDAQLWQAALAHVTVSGHSYTTDLHLSKLVAEFATANQSKLDLATFQELTSANKLRKVDPDVALALCGLDDFLSAGTASAEEEAGLSSLQARCATALAENWKEVDHNDELVKGRKSAFLVELLGKCLAEAKAENEKLSGGKSAARSRTARPARVESQKPGGTRSRPSRH